MKQNSKASLLTQCANKNKYKKSCGGVMSDLSDTQHLPLLQGHPKAFNSG